MNYHGDMNPIVIITLIVSFISDFAITAAGVGFGGVLGQNSTQLPSASVIALACGTGFVVAIRRLQAYLTTLPGAPQIKPLDGQFLPMHPEGDVGTWRDDLRPKKEGA